MKLLSHVYYKTVLEKCDIVLKMVRNCSGLTWRKIKWPSWQRHKVMHHMRHHNVLQFHTLLECSYWPLGKSSLFNYLGLRGHLWKFFASKCTRWVHWELFLRIHAGWLRRCKGSKWGYYRILKIPILHRNIHSNSFIWWCKNLQNSVVPLLWSFVSFQPVDTDKFWSFVSFQPVDTDKLNLVLLKKPYQDHFLKFLVLLVSWEQSSFLKFPWELHFVEEYRIFL